MAGPYKRVRAPKGASTEDRLRLHMIEAPSGCWIWLGSRNRYGHGRIQMQGRTGYAHRVSYETFVGPIPDGMQIDHLCRRPACIRPLHLQPVTPSVNVLRGTSPGARARRRDNCIRGHPYADFGKMQAGRRVCRKCRDAVGAAYRSRPRGTEGADLRALRVAAGVSQDAVASLIGIHQARLSSIELGKADLSPTIAAKIHAAIANFTKDAAA